MSRNFHDLAARVRKDWSDDARTVNEAATSVFQAEVSMQLAFARELSCARKERKITQTELAEVSGVDQAEISRIENGRANPTLDTVSRLAAALGKEIRLSPAGG